jgi:uncharacterized SAM-binding protein YcdF (DUF218 family)
MILLIAGIISIIYYIVIIVYAGMKAAFSKVWILTASVFFALFYIMTYKSQWLEWFHKSAIIRFFIMGCIILGFCLFLIVEGCIINGMFKKESDGLDYIIILGAQVRGEIPSKALISRMNQGIHILKKNSEAKVILSGGKGEGESISEAEAMRRYLVKKGIQKKSMILENQSVNTLQNLKFSYEKVENKDKKIGIVTSGFHVFRAVHLAKKMGIKNVVGIASPADVLMEPHYMLREFFAVLKEKLTGNI